MVKFKVQIPKGNTFKLGLISFVGKSGLVSIDTLAISSPLRKSVGTGNIFVGIELGDGTIFSKFDVGELVEIINKSANDSGRIVTFIGTSPARYSRRKQKIMPSPAFEDYPSTLVTEPTAALVPPGNCQFTPEFISVPLLKRWPISPTSFVLRFSTPDQSKSLNLSTCACILAMAELPDCEGNPEQVVRPYTPISTNAQIGSFDLLVKNYGENGRLSTYLCTILDEGSNVSFKHIDLNVKIQAPFPFKKICMIVGGSGLTPMVQAAHAVLGDSSNDSEVVMLYGSRTSNDILGKELLDYWSDMSDKLSVHHYVSNEPKDSRWDGRRGRIDRAAIEEFFPPPEDKDSIIFICGPPPMYNAFCGPRNEKELSGILKEMGYSADQVFKF